jgi:glycosyltransferase involved in cell wall biosynthesis
MTPTPGVRVSIVTPVLNAAPFLVEAVESVLAQTCTAWELLLVDDGSTDASPAIAQHYADAHPDRIRCLAHDGRANRGASASRNLAIGVARGEYLAFLDADDVYLPGKLADQVPLLDAHPEAGMLYAATEYWYGWTGRAEDRARDVVWRRFGVAPNATIEPPRLLTTFLRDGGTVPCMGSVLVRRRVVEAVGGWEDAFRHICTDQVFHAKIALATPIYIADGCWDRYRQHEASSCRTVARAGQMEAAFLRYLTWLEGYVAQPRVGDPALDADLHAALQAALWRYRHPWLHRLERRAGHQVARVRAAMARAR